MAMGYVYAALLDRIVDAWPIRILLFCKSFAWYLLATVYPFNIQTWTWAIQKHPESATARAGLGDEYNQRGAYQEGFEEARKALELNPGLVRPWTIAGNALSAMGKHQEAWVYQSNALSLVPDDPDVLNNAAATLIGMGQEQKAEEYLLRAHELSPYHRRVNVSLGLLYVEQEQYDKGRGYLSHAPC